MAKTPEHEEAIKQLKKVRQELNQNFDKDQDLDDPGFVERAIEYCLRKQGISPVTRSDADKARKDLIAKK